MIRGRAFVWFVPAMVVLAVPARANAELVRFANGRTLSVVSMVEAGDHVTLGLRAGGEVTCPRASIVEVLPDEVPPDPPVAVASAGDPQGSPLHDKTRLEERPFAAQIAAVAQVHGVDPRLVHAVIEVESNYRPTARSRKGAMGLMQLMPATARQYAATNLYDPVANLDAGVRHLKHLLSRFELMEALAAYNAGELAVRRHHGVPPFAETREYVRRVLTRLSLS